MCKNHTGSKHMRLDRNQGQQGHDCRDQINKGSLFDFGTAFPESQGLRRKSRILSTCSSLLPARGRSSNFRNSFRPALVNLSMLLCFFPHYSLPLGKEKPLNSRRFFLISVFWCVDVCVGVYEGEERESMIEKERKPMRMRPAM